jgi:hypothetical protein
MEEQRGTRGGHDQRSQSRGQENQGKDSLYGQAQETMSNMAGRASDMWDDVYGQGERYYREGTRALGDNEGVVVALILGCAVGYTMGWLIHGQHAYSGLNWSGARSSVPDYARTGPRYERESNGRMSGRNSFGAHR